MSLPQIQALLEQLIALPDETEWVEFKVDNFNPHEIGEQVSALSNAAALHHKDRAFIVWGVEDKTHAIVGTSFHPRKEKIGNEELENWLCTLLKPQVQFTFREFECSSKPCVILEIEPASHRPIAFKGSEWIRVGSYKKRLDAHPEKEKVLWRLFAKESFESGIAAREVSADEVLSLIRYADYFRLSGKRLPENKSGILETLASEKLIGPVNGTERYNVTNLGIILFGEDIRRFDRLQRKSVRVVFYRGVNRVNTISEGDGILGYASGFSNLIAYILGKLPHSEEIREALRATVTLYPDIAIREIVANALIHQDFDATGTGPMVEVFSDRIEITNPGTPLIDVTRFLDLPPRSRNEWLAGLMRRLKICEERGSGIDKVLDSVEFHQLPPPDFTVAGTHTRVILYGPRPFSKMTKAERVRACYQHAGLQFVSNRQMTNASLRKRFSLTDEGYSVASRIIADAIREGLVRPYDPASKSRRHARYLPYWA